MGSLAGRGGGGGGRPPARGIAKTSGGWKASHRPCPFREEEAHTAANLPVDVFHRLYGNSASETQRCLRDGHDAVPNRDRCVLDIICSGSAAPGRPRGCVGGHRTDIQRSGNRSHREYGKGHSNWRSTRHSQGHSVPSGTLPPTEHQHPAVIPGMAGPFQHVVMGGGATHGLMYIGVLMAHAGNSRRTYAEWARGIHTFAGSSMGALLAFALTCWDPWQTMQYFKGSRIRDIATQLFDSKAREVWRQKSINSGRVLDAVLSESVAHVAGDADVTFLQLHQSTGKRLVITVTDIVTGGAESGMRCGRQSPFRACSHRGKWVLGGTQTGAWHATSRVTCSHQSPPSRCSCTRPFEVRHPCSCPKSWTTTCLRRSWGRSESCPCTGGTRCRAFPCRLSRPRTILTSPPEPWRSWWHTAACVGSLCSSGTLCSKGC